MKKVDHVNVAVCVPSSGTWRAETARALALMFSHAAIHNYATKSQRVGIITSEGSMLSQMRENMVKKAMQSKATHVMFVDSDMDFPPNTLQRLLAAKKEYVAANCTTRVEPIMPVAHDLNGVRLSSKGKNGLQMVQHVGLAIALIEREVFERIRPPCFLMDWIPSMKAYCGEDVFFSTKVQELGYKVWVDHDLSREIRHVGHRSYGYTDLKEWEDGQVADGERKANQEGTGQKAGDEEKAASQETGEEAVVPMVRRTA
jgi:hypothetical protein